jgi:hypothetical protein
MGALRLFLSTLWKRSPSSSSLSPMLGTTALYDVAMVRLTVRTGRSRFHAAVGLFMALPLLGRTTSSKSKRKSCSAATPNLASGPGHFPRGQSRPVASPGPEDDLYRPQGPQTTRLTDFHSGLRPKTAQLAFDSRSEKHTCFRSEIRQLTYLILIRI